MLEQNTMLSTDDIIDRIDNEVNSLKSFLLDTKQSILSDNYDNAVHSLQQAENISTCSYCKQKLNKFIYDTEHVKNICKLKYKTCDNIKTDLISEINQFYNKLPDITKIRKDRAMNDYNSSTSTSTSTSEDNEDITKYIIEALMSPVNALGEMWDSLVKGLVK